MSLTDAQFTRYARHLILDEVGEDGQEKLLAARVLVVGAGGLGSPLLLYLAAAGVGTLGVVDDDSVDVTNLQRQVVHLDGAVGAAKVESAAATIALLNPGVKVIPHKFRLAAANVMEVIAGYDIVCDGSDNFATRYLLNDACYLARRKLVAASLLRFEGQLSTFRAYDRDPAGTGDPCYRCLFREAPPPDLVPRCEEAGILGTVAGVLGTLQATETIKEILGLGRSLSGRLMLYDALEGTSRTINVPRDPSCPLCGAHPSIRDLSGHK